MFGMYSTIMMNKTLTLPAEWETDGTILLAWPHADTDWSYMLNEVTDCYVDIVKAIANRQPVAIVAPDCQIVKDRLSEISTKYPIYYITLPTNDTWARDFGPLSVVDDAGQWHICDFKFNGWGLKFAADKDNMVTRGLCDSKFLVGRYDNNLGFVLEGGSIESDGKGTILTTSRCLLSPNRNGEMSKGEIERELKRRLGASRILWLNHGFLAGDDTDSHIDTLARLAPNDTIIYVGCNDKTDEHYAELNAMKHELQNLKTADGNPYNLVELPFPDKIFDYDGLRLPATYANFLVTPHAVYMPTYGQPQNDLLAHQMLKIVFQQDIVDVDCRPLIKQHGSLHCVTMQLPRQVICI